jgi:hypothetical protein
LPSLPFFAATQIATESLAKWEATSTKKSQPCSLKKDQDMSRQKKRGMICKDWLEQLLKLLALSLNSLEHILVVHTSKVEGYVDDIHQALGVCVVQKKPGTVARLLPMRRVSRHR